MHNISKIILYISICLGHRNSMIYDATGSVDHAAQWNLFGAAFGNKADLLRIGWHIAGLQSRISSCKFILLIYIYIYIEII